MCIECARERIEGDEVPVITPLMMEIGALVNYLYTLDNCWAGGGMHNVVDDTNIEDHSIFSCVKWLQEDHFNRNPSYDELRTCYAIAWGLMSLSEVQRALAVTVCTELKELKEYPENLRMEFASPIGTKPIAFEELFYCFKDKYQFSDNQLDLWMNA